MRTTLKQGWTIYYGQGYAEAWRHGVRMRANSLDLICTMFDLRPPFVLFA